MNPWIYWKTKKFNWKEERQVQKRYYANAQFKTLDLALKKAYRFKNPYQICRHHLQNRGAEEIHVYGETPLTTMGQIMEEFQLTAKDHIFELGAGRGRTSIFLAETIGCSVTAYEEIPDFTKILKSLNCPNLQIKAEDYFKADFSAASAIYLYGTMLSDQEILDLIQKFPPNCKIITVSYSLNAYSSNYQTIQTISGEFPWGETEVYLNERTC